MVKSLSNDEKIIHHQSWRGHAMHGEEEVTLEVLSMDAAIVVTQLGLGVKLCGAFHKWFIWLVLWNMNFMFPYIGNNHPNWLSYFSEG